MSKLKFSPNIFVGVQEWNIFQKNIDDSTKRNLLANTDNFGIVRQLNIPEIGNVDLANSFYVSKAGTPYDEVIIHEGVAIDMNGDFIINPESRNVKIPNDTSWYNIVITYDKTHREKGTVSIDTQGVLIGIGTEFTKSLRGFGEFNSKIRFLNSVSGNSREYEVAKVINDTTAVLVGEFIAEPNMQYGIYGTFLDGYQVPNDDKMIVEYDFFNFRLDRADAQIDLIDGREFLIAKVINNGLDITIEDARTEWWKSEAMNFLTGIDRTFNNKLIGVESVKWDVKSAPKDENLVSVGWNFKCTDYTIDSSSKKISLLIGSGGIFKNTSQFTAGDFNNWRVYSPKGNFVTVIDSQKSGTQIVLTTDILIPDDFRNVGTILISPPFEEIEIKVEGETEAINKKLKNTYRFNIQDEIGLIRLKTVQAVTKYNLQYRYKNFSDYSAWKNFPSDSIGYYDERSFDNFGDLNVVQNDRYQIPYDTAQNIFFLSLKQNSESYSLTIDRLDSGDLLGVNKTRLANEIPQINYFVGTDRKYQHFSDDPNAVLEFSADMVFVLQTQRQDGKPLRDGNCFYFHFTQNINLNGFNLKIVQNYQNATTFEELFVLTDNDTAYIMNGRGRRQNPNGNGLFITATWSADFQKWILAYETDFVPKGSLKMIGINAVPGGLYTYFNNGIGSKAPFFGWRIAADYEQKFLRVGNSGNFGIGGSDDKTLSLPNLPAHTHGVNDPGHAHQYHTGIEKVAGSGNQNAQSRQIYNGGEHTGGMDNATTGITIQSAGQGTSFDIKPAYKEIVLIEKYV